MPYADRDAVRRLAGNQVVADVTDAEIDKIIIYSDARVEAEVDHQGWIQGDQGFPLVQEASEYFAASTVLDRFADPEKKGDKFWQKALDTCDSIAKSSILSIIAISGEYKTYPLNQSANIYRSLPGSGSTEMERFY